LWHSKNLNFTLPFGSHEAQTGAATTVSDPACGSGSGSLLLKVGDEVDFSTGYSNSFRQQKARHPLVNFGFFVLYLL
jgi:hypothetical protein